MLSRELRMRSGSDAEDWKQTYLHLYIIELPRASMSVLARLRYLPGSLVPERYSHGACENLCMLGEYPSLASNPDISLSTYH